MGNRDEDARAFAVGIINASETGLDECLARGFALVEGNSEAFERGGHGMSQTGSK